MLFYSWVALTNAPLPELYTEIVHTMIQNTICSACHKEIGISVPYLVFLVVSNVRSSRQTFFNPLELHDEVQRSINYDFAYRDGIDLALTEGLPSTQAASQSVESKQSHAAHHQVVVGGLVTREARSIFSDGHLAVEDGHPKLSNPQGLDAMLSEKEDEMQGSTDMPASPTLSGLLASFQFPWEDTRRHGTIIETPGAGMSMTPNELSGTTGFEPYMPYAPTCHFRTIDESQRGELVRDFDVATLQTSAQLSGFELFDDNYDHTSASLDSWDLNGSKDLDELFFENDLLSGIPIEENSDPPRYPSSYDLPTENASSGIVHVGDSVENQKDHTEAPPLPGQRSQLDIIGDWNAKDFGVPLMFPTDIQIEEQCFDSSFDIWHPVYNPVISPLLERSKNKNNYSPESFFTSLEHEEITIENYTYPMAIEYEQEGNARVASQTEALGAEQYGSVDPTSQNMDVDFSSQDYLRFVSRPQRQSSRLVLEDNTFGKLKYPQQLNNWDMSGLSLSKENILVQKNKGNDMEISVDSNFKKLKTSYSHPFHAKKKYRRKHRDRKQERILEEDSLPIGNLGQRTSGNLEIQAHAPNKSIQNEGIFESQNEWEIGAQTKFIHIPDVSTAQHTSVKHSNPIEINGPSYKDSATSESTAIKNKPPKEVTHENVGSKTYTFRIPKPQERVIYFGTVEDELEKLGSLDKILSPVEYGYSKSFKSFLRLIASHVFFGISGTPKEQAINAIGSQELLINWNMTKLTSNKSNKALDRKSSRRNHISYMISVIGQEKLQMMGLNEELEVFLPNLLTRKIIATENKSKLTEKSIKLDVHCENKIAISIKQSIFLVELITSVFTESEPPMITKEDIEMFWKFIKTFYQDLDIFQEDYEQRFNWMNLSGPKLLLIEGILKSVRTALEGRKSMYDNGLLAWCLVEAWLISKKHHLKRLLSNSSGKIDHRWKGIVYQFIEYLYPDKFQDL